MLKIVFLSNDIEEMTFSKYHNYLRNLQKECIERKNGN